MIRFLQHAFALALLASVLPVSAAGHDDGVTVTPAVDLARDALEAERRGVAILLEFAAQDCPYCMQLEEEFLKPMLRSGEYEQKVIMRVVDIDRHIPLIDFQGQRSTTAALAQRFDIDLTPTMVLVNSSGTPLVKPIVGIWSLDFFGGIIDARIDTAVERVRKLSQVSD